MTKFNEKQTAEDYFIEKLQEKGWKFVPADELVRENYEEPLLVANLTAQLKIINKNPDIGENEIKQVVNELKLRSTNVEGIKQTLNFIKSGVPVKTEKTRTLERLDLIDYENIKNNEFIVTRQAVYQSGENNIRTDIVLYVNGIPLVNIECKNPASFTSDWFTAFEQIKRYEKSIPELYKYVQIGVAAESIAKYFPIVPWQEQDETRVNEWKEKNKDSIDSIIEMLSPQVLSDILKNYIFYRVQFGKATKIITRYMQYYASQDIVNRVMDNLAGRDDKNKGLTWHWQGSGKTLTMIFAAQKLFYAGKLENPSIFFIVDRIDLEEQLSQELNALELPVDSIGSVADLKNIIKHDDFRGKRGIMLALIHKFRPEELAELYTELSRLSAEKDTIQTRKNIVTFIDEAHRTQYGPLAGQMKNILKNSFYFAFTGTPISKKDRDTYNEYSYPPEEYYIGERYFVTESNADGFTKKIAYRPRLEKDVHLKKEQLKTFSDSDYNEIPEDIREKVKKRVQEKLNLIKAYMENPERIEIIARDIQLHFKENVDGKFKAMIVAVSREACVIYKKEMDKYLPPEYSEIVMTFKPDESKQRIIDYQKDLVKRYRGKEMGDIRKEVIEKFKEEDLPKILIVTDMLLTGFDAPILQTMYLDKPLKEHRLLQAIARTNRPYKDLKEAGLIIDYVGILKDFTRAFENYSKEDVQDVLRDIENLKKEFSGLLEKMLKRFEDVPKDKFDRKTILKAIGAITIDARSGKDFIENYKQLRRLFELLGTDEIKLTNFADYKWLTAVYIYYMKEVKGERPEWEKYVEKYFDKTVKNVHKATEIEELNKSLPEIVFDENYIKNIEQKVKSREEKAANIVFTLNRYVLVHKQNSPVYVSIADKVEHLIDKWKNKNRDFGEIYREGSEIKKEIDELTARQKKLGFSDLEYSILLTMEKKFGKRKEFVEGAKTLAERIAPEMFGGWVLQSTAKKNIERELRTFLRQSIKRYGITYEQMDELFSLIKDSIEKHGEKDKNIQSGD